MYTRADLRREAIPSKLESLNRNGSARKQYDGVCANIGAETAAKSDLSKGSLL